MKISNINQHHVNTHIKKKHLKLLSLCEFFFSSSETFNPTLTPSTTSFLSMTHFISETVSSLTQGEICLTCSACWPEQLFWQREAPTFAVELTQWNKRLSVLLQTVGFTTPTAKFKLGFFFLVENALLLRPKLERKTRQWVGYICTKTFRIIMFWRLLIFLTFVCFKWNIIKTAPSS